MADRRLAAVGGRRPGLCIGLQKHSQASANPRGSTLYWRGSATDLDRSAFADWFYSPDPTKQKADPVGFYGDLDFAGMQILAHLRQSFPTAKLGDRAIRHCAR